MTGIFFEEPGAIVDRSGTPEPPVIQPEPVDRRTPVLLRPPGRGEIPRGTEELIDHLRFS